VTYQLAGAAPGSLQSASLAWHAGNAHWRLGWEGINPWHGQPRSWRRL